MLSRAEGLLEESSFFNTPGRCLQISQQLNTVHSGSACDLQLVLIFSHPLQNWYLLQFCNSVFDYSWLSILTRTHIRLETLHVFLSLSRSFRIAPPWTNAYVPSLISALFQGKAYLLFQSPDKEWKYNLVQTQVLVEYQAKQLSFSNNSHT